MNAKIHWNDAASAREVLIWALGMALILIMGVKQWIFPAINRARELQGIVEAKKMEFTVFDKFEKDARAKPAPLANSKRELMKAKVQTALKESSLPQDVVVSELMSVLTRPDYSQYARMEGFEFKGDKSEKNYHEMSFEMKLVGSYDGLIRFLRAMQDLPYLVKISEIEVAPRSQEEYDQIVLHAKSVLYIPENSVSSKPGSLAEIQQLQSNLISSQSISNKSLFSLGPRGAAEWTLDELKLSGTMVGISHPTALINGEVFEIGNTVAGYQIVSIEQQEVVLKQGEKVHVLKIPYEIDRSRDSELPADNAEDSGEISKPEAVTSSTLPNEARENANHDDELQDENDDPLNTAENQPTNADAEDVSPQLTPEPGQEDETAMGEESVDIEEENLSP